MCSFSHINAEWQSVGEWERPQLLLLLLSHLLSLSLTLEFVTAFSKLQRWRSVILSHPKRKLYDKKEVFILPFMVTFTVKVLIYIDMFLKCCAKLKLNTWVRPSGFKDPGKGQRDEDRPADRSVTLVFLWNLASAEMRSPCTFFPHEAHAFSGGFYLPMHLGEPSKNGRKYIPLTKEKTLIYARTFATIFCLVNFRPVGAGRIFTFMAEVKSWWAMK